MGEVPTDYGILVGVDGSAESDVAIRWATREATMRGVPITVMHVVPPIPEWPTPSWQSEIAEVCEQNARNVIEQARKPSSPVGVNPIPPTCAPKWSVRPSCRHSSTHPSTPG